MSFTSVAWELVASTQSGTAPAVGTNQDLLPHEFMSAEGQDAASESAFADVRQPSPPT
jgi:hypothetical protein